MRSSLFYSAYIKTSAKFKILMSPIGIGGLYAKDKPHARNKHSSDFPSPTDMHSSGFTFNFFISSLAASALQIIPSQHLEWCFVFAIISPVYFLFLSVTRIGQIILFLSIPNLSAK